MWSIITVVALVFIMIMGIVNIRSLIRKMKANPNKWFDLGIGILVWGFAFVLLLIQLLKQLELIR